MTAAPAAMLIEFAGALGISEESFRESRDDVTVTESIARLPPRTTLEPLLEKLTAHYGDSVTFEVSSGHAQLFDVSRTLDELYESASVLQQVDIYVSVRKTRLLELWGISAASCTFVLYFFPEQLAKALQVPLFKLKEAGGLLNAFATTSKIVILVPTHDIHLDGPLLSILGGDAAKQWSASTVVTAVVPPDPELVRRRLKWVDHNPKPLTPLHLTVQSKDTARAKDDAVAGALYAQWATCSIFYLADYSRWDEKAKSWLVTFAAEKFATSAEIGPAESVRASLEGEWKRAAALGAIVTWVYEDEKRIADRLTIVQNVAGNELEDNDPAVNARELIRRADDLRVRAEGAWRAFIAQKLDKYFGQVKQLEETVDATMRAYDEQIQQLTKSLSDNILAAVAVVVGSFIAAMFKSPFQAYAFWFGATVYLAYLVIFPICVGLTATKKRFSGLHEAFEKRRRDFNDRLTEQEVKKIVEPVVPNREQSFLNWLRLARWLYGAVVVALVAAILCVPPLIEQWGDEFTMRRIEIGRPANGVIPMKIHGTNFDRNREIVVLAGSSVYATSDKSVTVYGSTVLALSARETDLPSKKAVKVVVRQGKAEGWVEVRRR